MKHCLLVFAAVVALAISVPASAQYMFLDLNGDGACTSADVLTTGTTSVDVWLKTNQNFDGSTAACPTGPSPPDGGAMTINSYTFILSAVGGGVTYNSWADNMGFTINAGPPGGFGTAGNDAWVAKASGTIVPPGTFKLGTMSITVASASARLEFRELTSIDPTAITSFGCSCPGAEFNNTMRYSPVYPSDGDWGGVNGACGTANSTPATETTWGKIKNLYR